MYISLAEGTLFSTLMLRIHLDSANTPDCVADMNQLEELQ